MKSIGEAVTEVDLWSLAIAGDAHAFGAIYDLHRDRVFGHSLRLLKSSHDAEDVTALVFLETWRRRRDVRLANGSIVGWMLVTTNFIVQNHSRTSRRHRAALARLPLPEPQSDHADDVLGAIGGKERDRELREAFGQLTKADQDVLTLCVLEGLSMTAAGAALGIPHGTVKSRLSRAKRRLAERLSATPFFRNASLEWSNL